MKRYLFLLALLTIIFSCANGNKCCKKKSFDFTGSYQSSSMDSISVGYFQNIQITKDSNEYFVKFSGSLVKGEPACEFSSKAELKDDSLIVNIGDNANNKVRMFIVANADRNGIEVNAKTQAERYKLMYYCAGGGSLVGDYFANTISKDSLGKISRSATMQDLALDSLNCANNSELYLGTDKVKLYRIFFDNNKKIKGIEVYNPLFHTDKNIAVSSTAEAVLKAYPKASLSNDSIALDSLKMKFMLTKPITGKAAQKNLPDSKVCKIILY